VRVVDLDRRVDIGDAFAHHRAQLEAGLHHQDASCHG